MTKVYGEYYTDGRIETFNPPVKMNLKEMQEFVGGLITYCPCNLRRRQLIVNDEGALIPLPVNIAATKIVPDERVILVGGVLYGNALLVGA